MRTVTRFSWLLLILLANSSSLVAQTMSDQSKTKSTSSSPQNRNKVTPEDDTYDSASLSGSDGYVLDVTSQSLLLRVIAKNSSESKVIALQFTKLVKNETMAFPKYECLCYSHADIKVGDKITAEYLKADDGILYAVAFTIRRRPGDVVPASRYKYEEGRRTTKPPYHESANVGNDIEDGKILDENVLRKHGHILLADRLYGKKDPMKKDDTPLKAPSAEPAEDKPPTEKK
jgi:hypothetical protein